MQAHLEQYWMQQIAAIVSRNSLGSQIGNNLQNR